MDFEEIAAGMDAIVPRLETLKHIRRGHFEMIDFGLLVFVVIAYLSGYPGFAFLLVILGLLSGILGLVKAITNRQWYESQALEAGVEPNYAMLVGTKVVVFAVLLWAAWFTGTAANYF